MLTNGAHVIRMVPDALGPNKHQAINNHKADLIVTTSKHEHIMLHVYCVTTIKQTMFERGGVVARQPIWGSSQYKDVVLPA